ncbi:MAG: hypothetical protein IPN84_14880 [Sphingomonadales bacterium]|jgi:hypothetical protein|nr:hypothetical protein [Sphingomonadales bacterium]
MISREDAKGAVTLFIPLIVIPAKAGTHERDGSGLDAAPRLRGGDDA